MKKRTIIGIGLLGLVSIAHLLTNLCLYKIDKGEKDI